MKIPKWILHPLSIFIYSLLAIATSLFLYLYWYINLSRDVSEFVEKFSLDKYPVTHKTWVIVLTLSILVTTIITGIVIIYIYYNRTIKLYRLQKNFIDNFTHELKTPLTSLKLFLETLNKYELSREEQLNCIQLMMDDTTRLTGHVEKILSLGQLESNTYQLNYSTVSIGNYINNFLMKNEAVFQDAQIDLETNNYEREHRIDTSLFDAVLTNIISNGIKYNDSENPIIKISIFANKKNTAIVFKDNGIGIFEPNYRKIFKKFYRISNKTSRAKGTGLGLFLVKTIVNYHGGKITVYKNSQSIGTTFTVTLPYNRGTNGA